MSKITPITSLTHFRTVLKSTTYVVADFYADWCGPCKAIAPVFEQLARDHGKPSRIAFVKVDVDAQQEIAREYGVSAMPTFLILKSGTTAETIRGANPSALRSAVVRAATDSAVGAGGQGQAFTSKGHVLGSDSTSGSSKPGRGNNNGSSGSWSQWLGLGGGVAGLGTGWADTMVRFLGLYFVSLISFDGYKAAEESGFNVRNRGRVR